MAIGWKQIGGNWYYLNAVSNGETGWSYQKESDSWNYGAGKTLPLGALFVSTVTPDGYNVDENGVWLP